MKTTVITIASLLILSMLAGCDQSSTDSSTNNKPSTPSNTPAPGGGTGGGGNTGGGGGSAAGAVQLEKISPPEAGELAAMEMVAEARKALNNGNLELVEVTWVKLAPMRDKVGADVQKHIDNLKTEIEAAKAKGAAPATQPAK